MARAGPAAARTAAGPRSRCVLPRYPLPAELFLPRGLRRSVRLHANRHGAWSAPVRSSLYVYMYLCLSLSPSTVTLPCIRSLVSPDGSPRSGTSPRRALAPGLRSLRSARRGGRFRVPASASWSTHHSVAQRASQSMHRPARRPRTPQVTAHRPHLRLSRGSAHISYCEMSWLFCGPKPCKKCFSIDVRDIIAERRGSLFLTTSHGRRDRVSQRRWNEERHRNRALGTIAGRCLSW